MIVIKFQPQQPVVLRNNRWRLISEVDCRPHFVYHAWQQGRNQAGLVASGVRSKFGAPIFEPDVFWKQIYRIEESTCDIVGTFWRPPQSFGAYRSCLAPP